MEVDIAPQFGVELKVPASRSSRAQHRLTFAGWVQERQRLGMIFSPSEVQMIAQPPAALPHLLCHILTS